MYEQFIEKNFKADSLALIEQANEIIAEYAAQGFALTLRQLYYQFVARGLIPNNMRSYKRLGSVVNDGRMAGLMDWEAIEDRTRNMVKNSHWSSPRGILESARASYGIDMWANQPTRVEVWIEKEALSGVLDGVCRELDVPYFACRGYVSQSEQWRAGVRFRRKQHTVILHFGDHDPSGIDMTRDNIDRLDLFSGGRVTVERIALNMDQVEQYDPPPNPAKITDSRAEGYIARFGRESWELDALEPRVITRLIRDNVAKHRDDDLWSEQEIILQNDLETLDDIIENLE